MRDYGEGRAYLRGSRYWIEFWYRGTQYREPGGKTEEEALKRLKARRKQVLGDKFIGIKEEKVLVTELLNDLETYLSTKGAKSADSFTSHLKPVREFFANVRAIEVTTALVDRYIKRRLTGKDEEGQPIKDDKGKDVRPRSRATVNRETGGLKQAFNLAFKRQPPKISRLPYITHLTEDNARSGFVEPSTFEVIASNLTSPVDDIARFAYHSAWRKSEVVLLKWESVDRRSREARLRTSKNGKPRTLPLTGELWDVIERRWNARSFKDEKKVTRVSEYVFHVGDGNPVVDFKKSWATACKTAGAPGLLFHDLRRSAVRNMVRAGVPQSIAMRISGHRTTSMFTRYDITSEADKVEALKSVQEYINSQKGQAPKTAAMGEKATG